MSNFTEATIEEFEQGAWVADLVSFEPFSGSFDLGGDTWVGSKVSERLEFGKYHTRVVGGAGKLSVTLADKWYDGSVSLQAAVQDVCREAGESFGAAQAGVFLSSFERLKGSAAQALDAIANAFGLLWWVDRSGKVNMQSQRPGGPDASGTRVVSDSDASIVLVDPSGVRLGVGYISDTAAIAMPQIRHVRWHYQADRFSAQLYPLPFVFRPPVRTTYDSLYSASVDRDNGDGTVDVIAAGRFGVTRVPLLCGVPGSKVTVRGGEQVTLGFFGGDPQKPFAVAMAQDTTATKEVARNGDSVKVTITGPQLAALAGFFVSPAGPCVYTPGPMPPPPTPAPAGMDVTGTVTSGTARIKVGD